MQNDPFAQPQKFGPSTQRPSQQQPAAGASQPQQPGVSAGSQSPPMGRPMQEGSFYSPGQSERPPSSNKLVLGICVAGLAIAAIGVGKSVFFPSEPKEPKPVVRQPSIWSEQQKVMRDAMQMAREAQQMQREHMERMRQAMEMEAGYMGADVYPGYGEEE